MSLAQPPADSGGDANESGSGTADEPAATAQDKPAKDDTSWPRPAIPTTDRSGSGDTARLSRSGATTTSERPATEDTARLSRPGRAAGTFRRPAPSGAYEPLIPDASGMRANWQQVQGSFVDDPRAAVSDAADLVEHASQVLVGALRQRQAQLRGMWDDTAAADAAIADAALAEGGRADGSRTGSRRDSGWFGSWQGGNGQGGGRRVTGWRGGGRRADGGTQAGGTTQDPGQAPADGSQPGDSASRQWTAGIGVTDATEHLRLVMQRYRSLFNQICRP